MCVVCVITLELVVLERPQLSCSMWEGFDEYSTLLWCAWLITAALQFAGIVHLGPICILKMLLLALGHTLEKTSCPAM